MSVRIASIKPGIPGRSQSRGEYKKVSPTVSWTSESHLALTLKFVDCLILPGTVQSDQRLYSRDPTLIHELDETQAQEVWRKDCVMVSILLPQSERNCGHPRLSALHVMTRNSVCAGSFVSCSC